MSGEHRPKKRALPVSLTVLAAVLTLSPSGLLFETEEAASALHTVLELVAVTVSMTVAALSWNLRKSEANSHSVVIGSAFFVVGVVDALHMLAWPSMPDFVTANNPEKALFFYLSARALAASALLWVAATSVRTWRRRTVALSFSVALAVVFLTGWIGLFRSTWIPETFLPDAGLSPAYLITEGVLAAAYAGASALFIWRDGPSSAGRCDLAIASWLLVLVGLFMSIFEDFRDSHIVVGHLYNGLAYVFIYRGLFVDGVEAPYRVIAEQERHLRTSHHTLTSVVESLPIGVVLTEPTGRIRFANVQLRTMFGYGAEDLTGRSIDDLVPHASRSGHAAQRRGFSAEPRVRAMSGRTLSGQRADGSTFPIEVGLCPVEIQGETLTLAAAVDLTERQKDAAELEAHRNHLEDLVAIQTRDLTAAMTAADAANKAKSAFLANMSHEIRTPMHAIFGMSTLIREEPLSAEQRRRLDKLDSAARHLMNIIGDVLDLSKIETGKLQLEHVPLQVEELVDSVVALLSPLAAGKGLTLTARGHEGLPPLLGDPTRVRQCLLNLVHNALKFTHVGDVEIVVSTLEADTGSVHLQISVRDTGEGLRPDQLARLFQPFEQADASTTRVHGGTGLGLAITRRIARLMGGDAGGDSAPGVGSQFWFSVRLDVASAQRDTGLLVDSGDPRADILARHSGRRVLLVDDDPVNCEIAGEILKMAGLVVDVAHDGVEGLERATAAHALILLDMHMPRMGGLEAAVRLREGPDTRRTPLVALTASAYPSDRQACLDAGMSDFIAKPVTDVTAVYNTLLRWLDTEATS